MRALTFRNQTEENRAIAQLKKIPTLPSVVGQLVPYSRNLAGSERFARVLLEPDNAAGLGNTLLAQLELAKGRWHAAEEKLVSGSPSEINSIVASAFVASLPFVPIAEERLLQLRNGLRKGNLEPDTGEVTRDRLVRTYLLGTLSARAGDNAAALRYAAALSHMEIPPHEASLARNLALGIQAYTSRWQGRREAALQLLEQIMPTARREELSQSPIHALAVERYLRADLLRELGRGEEALAWYASMAQLSSPELVFLAPAHMRRAEIYESLGKKKEAAAHYARFIELWKDADPESQSLVAEARSRLERLRQLARR
ncbi:MAG: tetratricopeptide repeat protein [Gemmatimonadaceae bacterium]